MSTRHKPIKLIKKHEKNNDYEEYISDPVESISILKKNDMSTPCAKL